VRVMKYLRTLLLALAGVGLAAPLLADTIGINVLNATHSTSVVTSTLVQLAEERQTISATETLSGPNPISDALSGTSARIFANASADLFSVSAATSALYATMPGQSDFLELHATAHAIGDTVLDFSPVFDALAADLDLIITTTGINRFTEGVVSLVDQTTNTELWNYHWDWLFVGNLPFWEDGSGRIDPLGLSPDLFASHVYTLTLHTESDASTDQQGARIEIAGLTKTVPEPATLLLLAVGSGGLSLAHRRRRH
jgi:hypothetical protein